MRRGGLVSGHDYQFIHQAMGDGYTFGVKDAVDEFARARDVDVALVVKNDKMFSAAQSVRARLAPLGQLAAQSYGAALDVRLRAAADRLAGLARSGQLVLFLGSGTSQTNDMPGWSELLMDLASPAGLSPGEVEQLTSHIKQLEAAKEAAVESGVQVHDRGTYVCMEGPAFSTRAESNLW